MRGVRMTFLTLAMLGVVAHCAQISGDQPSAKEPARIEIIEVAGGRYGYDIFIDGKLKIHQPHIPTVKGAKGFDSRIDAEITAQAVVKKLQEHQNPPTLTSSELEMMGVISGK